MNFKLSEKDRKTLFIFLSIIVIAASYFFVYAPNMSKVSDLNSDIDGLKSQLQVLDSMESEIPALNQEIEACRAEVTSILSNFTCFISEEKMIESIIALRETTGVDVTSATFSLYELFYPTDLSTEQLENPDGQATEQSDSSMKAYKNGLTLSYDCTYEQLKSMIDYFNQNNDNDISIKSLSVKYDTSTGNLQGSIDVFYNFVVPGGTPYIEPVFKCFSIGTDNIFGTNE